MILIAAKIHLLMQLKNVNLKLILVLIEKDRHQKNRPMFHTLIVYIIYLPAFLISILMDYTDGDKLHKQTGFMMQVSKIQLTEELKQRLSTFIDQQPAKIAMAFSVLNEDIYIGIHDTISMHAASTMKIPVMIEVFRQSEQYKFKLSDSILIKNEFRSIVDESVYHLDIKDDSADRLYSIIGQRESVKNLVVEMITSSGNLATNLLVELTGAKNIEASMRQLGARRIKILRGVEDGKAYQIGLNNTTTAQDLTIILQAIATGKAGSSVSTDTMIQILSEQKFNEKIPAGLPAGIKVAHKTGSVPGYVEHDAGIIYLPDQNPLILTVLTQSFATAKEANNCIAGITRMIYDWYVHR